MLNLRNYCTLVHLSLLISEQTFTLEVYAFKSSMVMFLKMLHFEGKIQACFLLTSSMAIWSMM